MKLNPETYRWVGNFIYQVAFILWWICEKAKQPTFRLGGWGIHIRRKWDKAMFDAETKDIVEMLNGRKK